MCALPPEVFPRIGAQDPHATARGGMRPVAVEAHATSTMAGQRDWQRRMCAGARIDWPGPEPTAVGTGTEGGQAGGAARAGSRS